MADDDAEENNEAQDGNEDHRIATLMMHQHWNLQQLVQEEMLHLCESSGQEAEPNLMRQAKGELHELEQQLMADERRLKSLTTKVEDEVL